MKQKQVFSEESQSVENDFLKQQIKIRNKISALLRNDVEIEQILAVLLKYFAADGTALYRLTASTTVDQDNPIDVHYYPEHSVNLPCSECPLIALAKKGGCHNVQRISDLCPSVQPSCVFHPNAEAMLILCGKVRNRHYVLFLQRNEIPFSVSEYHLLRSLKPLLFNILIYKLNQEETRTLQEQLSLRQHHNAIGYFARGISHELNTPLQSLIGNLLFVRSAVEDLFLLIDELAKLSSGTNEIDRHLFDSKVRHLIKDKEMDYIADELPLAFLDSMKAKKKIADLI
ncbi:MAG: hypothetical protein U9R69_06560, partial [Thermodesulfobacteriota bacterium]|nr:hypothetical protein [Thermodesulfobacteriota bacterium]